MTTKKTKQPTYDGLIQRLDDCQYRQRLDVEGLAREERIQESARLLRQGMPPLPAVLRADLKLEEAALDFAINQIISETIDELADGRPKPSVTFEHYPPTHEELVTSIDNAFELQQKRRATVERANDEKIKYNQAMSRFQELREQRIRQTFAGGVKPEAEGPMRAEASNWAKQQMGPEAEYLHMAGGFGEYKGRVLGETMLDEVTV